MYSLYSFLLTLGFILLLPRLALDALRSGKYVTGLSQRLGSLPPQDTKADSVTIWLHCVSVGEALAAQSLVRALTHKFPAFRLVVSTTTVTGQQVARDIFREHAASVFYFPIDWAWTMRRALRAINPSAVIVMETELWPRLFRECRKRQIPLALINGRISDKSFQRYKLVRAFIGRVLNDLTIALMQSAQDADRIRELGLTESRIVVSGNLKFDSASAALDPVVSREIGERFSFDSRRPLILAASTHAPEEATMLEVLKRTRESHANTRLLLAPRHPERFDEVAGLIDRAGLTWASRSEAPSVKDGGCDVVLLDTIGELSSVFPLADIVFVGGSIAAHGGHNVLEPAAHGVCTITGPHTQNFAAITKAMIAEDALIQLAASSDLVSELAAVISQLLSNEERRQELGERARSFCRNNQGATARTIELISQLLAAPSSTMPAPSFPALRVTTAE